MDQTAKGVENVCLQRSHGPFPFLQCDDSDVCARLANVVKLIWNKNISLMSTHIKNHVCHQLSAAPLLLRCCKTSVRIIFIVVHN